MLLKPTGGEREREDSSRLQAVRNRGSSSLQATRKERLLKAAGGERGDAPQGCEREREDSPSLQAAREGEAPQGCRRRERERLPKPAGGERG
jgi:hypothetical protein